MRSLSSVIAAAKNAWDQPSPWLWLMEVERDDWYMIEYAKPGQPFQDSAELTGSNGGTAKIVVNIVTHVFDGAPVVGFLIIENTTSTFTAGEIITDNSGGTAQVSTTIDTTTADPVIARFCRNVENVFYEYELVNYYAFPFNIGMASSAKSQFRSVDITFSNALGVMEAIVRRADGFIGARIGLKIVWAGDLSATPAWEEEYEVKKSTIKRDTVSCTCAQDNFLLRGFPRYRYSRKRCRWRFKSDSCGYAGANTSCNRLLDGCITNANTSRFGGFPAIPGGFFSI